VVTVLRLASTPRVAGAEKSSEEDAEPVLAESEHSPAA